MHSSNFQQHAKTYLWLFHSGRFPSVPCTVAVNSQDFFCLQYHSFLLPCTARRRRLDLPLTRNLTMSPCVLLRLLFSLPVLSDPVECNLYSAGNRADGLKISHDHRLTGGWWLVVLATPAAKGSHLESDTKSNKADRSVNRWIIVQVIATELYVVTFQPHTWKRTFVIFSFEICDLEWNCKSWFKILRPIKLFSYRCLERSIQLVATVFRPSLKHLTTLF